MTGVGDNPSGQIEEFRQYLRLLADVLMPAELQAKLDQSDIVQETLAKAHEKRGQFQGASDAQLAAWLRSILSRELADAVRQFCTAKRDMGLEMPLDKAVEDSATRLEDLLAAEGRCPGSETIHQEDLLKLSAALAELPNDQRQAVEMKHLQGLSVAEISDILGRSKIAVGGLLRRGMQTLRQLIPG